MTLPLQSPEIQAVATGFPVTLLHAGVTVVILFAAVVLFTDRMWRPHSQPPPANSSPL